MDFLPLKSFTKFKNSGTKDFTLTDNLQSMKSERKQKFDRKVGYKIGILEILS